MISLSNKGKKTTPKVTENFTLEYISETINSSADCVKTSIKRLEKRGLLNELTIK
jgi:hypothetical protein